MVAIVIAGSHAAVVPKRKRSPSIAAKLIARHHKRTNARRFCWDSLSVQLRGGKKIALKRFEYPGLELLVGVARLAEDMAERGLKRRARKRVLKVNEESKAVLENLGNGASPGNLARDKIRLDSDAGL